MANTITNAKLTVGLNIVITNDDSQSTFTKGLQSLIQDTMQVSSAYVFDQICSAVNKELLSAANDDIDLYDLGAYDVGNGAGRDSTGLAMTNATIHYMFIRNRSTSAGNLVVNTSVSNGWRAWIPSGTITLTPGSFIVGYWPDGLAVTDASAHMIRLTASGDDVNYDFEFVSA